jgi:hypothetical protein
MAKQSKNETSQKPSGFDINKLIPEKFHNLAAIGLIVLVFIIFFNPMYFGGKSFQSGDIITIKSMTSYVEKDREGFSLWNPYIFCGIPAYATGTELRWWDLIGNIYSYGKYLVGQVFSVEYAMHTINLFLIALTSFFFMRSRKADALISLTVALAATFSTGIVFFIFVGHITKMISLAAFPLILMMLLKFNERIKLLDVLIMIAFMHFVVLGAHVQIIFYIFLTVAIYYIFYFIKSFLEKDKLLTKQLFKSAGVVVVSIIVAMLMSLDTYASLWEYNQTSTRGTKSIIAQADEQKSEQEFYDYATNWSFSPGEIMTFVVPSYYGFGNTTYQGPLTNNEPAQINTYFGPMPFVDVAMYMGSIIFFLGLFGFYVKRKDPFVQFLGVVVILFLLMSFGKNFSFIYDLFYHYVPFFNKFRVPSMILTIIQISFPIVAGLGIMQLMESKKQNDLRIEKSLRVLTIFFGSAFLLSIVLGSVIGDWFISHIQSAGEKGMRFQQIHTWMADTFRTDLTLSMLFTFAAFGTLYLYFKNKLNISLAVAIIAILILVDLFRIGSRGAHYSDDTDFKNVFTQPDYITSIKNQNDSEPYRILNLKEQGLGSLSQNSNFNVYFLEQDFHGYSSVKPRTYQDLMDVAGPTNPTLWRMLNVKYITVDKPIQFPGFTEISSNPSTVVYKNESALPRAYFVDSVATLSSLEVLNLIKNNLFDPKKLAYLEDENINTEKPDSSATTKIIKYDEALIQVEVNASGNNFLFLGDTYYPNGWKAFIDGIETPIYRTNHGFRGVLVSQGKHLIEFKYEPQSFILGKYVSLTLNLVVIGLFIVGFIFSKKQKAQQ